MIYGTLYRNSTSHVGPKLYTDVGSYSGSVLRWFLLVAVSQKLQVPHCALA